MSWNTFLLATALTMLVVFFSAEVMEYSSLAARIAEDLAPQIGVDEDMLRSRLRAILLSGTAARAVADCFPLALLCFLLTVRLVADLVRRRRRGRGDGVNS